MAIVSCLEAKMKQVPGLECTFDVENLLHNDRETGFSVAKALEHIKEHGIQDKKEGYLMFPISSFDTVYCAAEIKKALKEGPLIIGVFTRTGFGMKEDWEIYDPDLLEMNYDVVDKEDLIGRHAMVAIHHGTKNDGTEYYVVQNSKGLRWGINGYGRVLCDDARYPAWAWPMVLNDKDNIYGSIWDCL